MWFGIIALFVAGIIGGVTPVILKLGLKEFPPILLTTLRFIIASLILLPFYLKQKKSLNKKDIIKLFKYSIFFSLNVGIFSIAIQFTTAIMSQILYTLVPVIVVILSYFFLKETINKQKIIGLIIASVGVCLLLYNSATGQEVLTFGTPFGNLLGLIAVFFWSCYLIFSKKLTDKYSIITTSFASYITTVFILMFLVPVEYLLNPVENISMGGVANLFWLGIISSALMFFLIQIAVKKTSPFTASFFQYLGPFAGSLFSIPILGEKLQITLIFGGLLIILGVFYSTSYEQLRKYLKSVL